MLGVFFGGGVVPCAVQFRWFSGGGGGVCVTVVALLATPEEKGDGDEDEGGDANTDPYADGCCV